MSVYLVPHLPKERAFTWVLTLDPNKRAGGLLTAIDFDDNWYVVAEHYREGVPDRVHAQDYLRLLASLQLKQGRDVAVWADPGGAGSQAIVNFAEVGLFAAPVPKDAGSVKASIERIRRAAWIDPSHRHPLTGVQGAPHLYFLTSLRSQWRVDGVQYDESRLLWELRQYRQKEGGKPDEPVKERDDCVDCLRYLALVRQAAPTVADTSRQQARARLDGVSRRADEEFERLVKAQREPQRRAVVW